MDDILAKLPLRNLVRFKCVCKAWNNSIPRIAKSTCGPRKFVVTPYHSRPYTCIKIVDYEAAASSNTETYTDSQTREMIQRIKLPINVPGKVVGSCNGLLFIEFERKRNRFVLWNPLIKDFKVLPDLKPSKRMLDFSGMIGFGHDGCSDDYKIVRIFAYQDCSFEALVYSLKTNSWRYWELEQPFSNNNIYEFLKSTPCMATLVNGALYWPVSDLDVSDDEDWFEYQFYTRDRPQELRFRILRFLFADEKLSWMQPPVDVEPDCNQKLVVFEGNKLCAYQNVLYPTIIIWVLEEGEEIEGGEETEGDEEITEDEEIEEDEETESEWTGLMSITIPQGRMLPERNFAPLAFMTVAFVIRKLIREIIREVSISKS